MEKCELRISERGLHHNIRLVRRIAAGTQVIGVVKGNGYGLGLLELAGHLVDYGVRRLAVSELEDALTLRNYGIWRILMPCSVIRNCGWTRYEWALPFWAGFLFRIAGDLSASEI